MMKSIQKVYIPGDGPISEEDLWAWYCNITKELDLGLLEGEELACFQEYYREAGLIRWWRRPFFRHHFCRTFAKSVAFLSAYLHEGAILDLGCGCGTQSIYMAIKGARVVALDLDQTALEVFMKRKKHYEQVVGRNLDITIHCADSFEFDYASVTPLVGLHSMFAFNMMQPSSRLVNTILPHLTRRACITVLDGNSKSWMLRLLPWRRRDVWSPEIFRGELVKRGFSVSAHEGGVAIPPLIWRGIPYYWGALLDRWLSNNWFFPLSHLILAERKMSQA
jgi:SAM-dependent methyltransferase